jgi:ketosteroid isomerase-like protein
MFWTSELDGARDSSACRTLCFEARVFRRLRSARLGRLFDDGLKLLIKSVLIEGDRAVVELFSRASPGADCSSHNEYCWVCRFNGEEIVEVCEYLDLALVTKLIEEGEARAT